ncbi:MAG: ThuA domain-containing protein [Planctomycetes bacterium]|nr:ThuA domain-containing protein [Planctomycetota bacterium]
MLRGLAPAFVFSLLTAGSTWGAPSQRLQILFLGDRGHHLPAERFQQLAPVLAARRIDLIYTDQMSDLNPRALEKYDGLIIYANITEISPEQEAALLDYVAGGKGFIPLHCASYCFLNSPKYAELVGAQFQRHGTGVFRTAIASPGHPVMEGFGGFESWDESYVHHRHNDQDRTILEVRADSEGANSEAREPWTWVRAHGKGRIFYTAWGHDERTWGNPGFHNLVERGLRWAVGDDPAAVPPFTDQPEMTPQRTDVRPFEYVDANIPFYPAGERWGVTGDPIKKMQAPLPPAESMKHYVTPAGFEVRLFASEPDLGGKPICMGWDERGRLWVVETYDYPNEQQPEGQGRDRIRICEDADGDGRADKFTVFAEKLSIPTSLTFSRGGAIVHQYPHTLFLVDTDGDDRADERRVLFTGWSAADTHAGPSNLNYGFDNWIYGIVGYSGFEGEAGGEKHSFRTGFYRFKPDGSKLEFLRNTNNNSWGVGFSEEGILFGSTANGNPSEYMPIPNRHYESVRGWSSTVLNGIAGNPRFQPITGKVRQVDYHGRFTSAAGHALYTARAYPREYWNRAAFVCEPTGHLVATFLIQSQGADYRSRNAWNLLASDDEWAAPIMAEVGPDGHVWVIDWYNLIVQHNPTPAGFKTGKGNAYETELRDKKHGRIYRIVYTAAEPDRPFNLAGASPEKLVETLRHENLLWRRHAQRLLVERGRKDVLPALIELASDPSMDDLGLNPGAIHALWTMHGLGALDGAAGAVKAAAAALRHPSAGVRRTAALVLPRTVEAAQTLVASGLLTDMDGQVRLAAFLALAEMPASPLAASALAAALPRAGNPGDRWLVDAATSAAAAHERHFLPAALAGAPGPFEHLPATAQIVRIVSEHYARQAPADSIKELIDALAASAEARLVDAAIGGLARGWPKDKAVPLDEGTEKALLALLAKASPESRGQLVALAMRWGSASMKKHAAEIAASFLETARDEKAGDPFRASAAAQLIEFRKNDAAAVREVIELITPRASPELGAGLIEATSRSEAREAGEALLEAFPIMTPSMRQAAIRVLIGRADWTEVLLAGLEDGQVQLSELALDQKQGLAAHPAKEIAERARALLARGGGLPNADRQKVLDELMPLAQKTGDPAAGKEAFKNFCAKCHTHSGEGTKIGPDLTGMAVHPKSELLLNVIDPNRSVEGNFRIYTVVTRNQRVLNGLLASENKSAIELFDTEGKKSVILREDIKQLVASTLSLMPEGFENQMSPENIANLLEFLTQRGKYLPIPLNRVATISSSRGMFYDENSPVERLIFSDWSPKTVEGVPFYLIDPQDGRSPNAILLYGPEGKIPPRMPRSVTLPCRSPAKAIHMLSGVSGWGYPLGEKGSVSVIVRLHYESGGTEDHELKNGEQFADYIRRVDVPRSKFAFALRGRQIRYLAVQPARPEAIEKIELIKGPDRTAPVVMAVTVETPD